MKKYALFILIITILFSGCTPSVGESKAGVGHTASPSGTDGISSESHDCFRAGTYVTFAETEDFYFWRGMGPTYQMVHYYEKSSGVSGFLCFKPECRHNDRGCDAFVGLDPLTGDLAVRDGMLYWIGCDVSIDPGVEEYAKKVHATFGVWRMKIDGTGREFYGSLSYDEYVNYNYQRAYLWGDYYYFAGSQQMFQLGATESEPEFSEYVTLTRVPLSGGAVELLAELSDVENASPPMMLLGADSVYLFTDEHEEKSDGGYTHSLTLLQYHIAENRVEMLLKNQEMMDGMVEVRLHPEKGILVTPRGIKANGEDNPGDPLLYSLSDGGLTPWLDFSESSYDYIRVMEEGLLLTRFRNGEIAYELRDIEGNVVSSGTLPLPFLSSTTPGAIGLVAAWGGSREFFIEMWDWDIHVHYLVRYRVTPEGLQETLLMQAEDKAFTETNQ